MTSCFCRRCQGSLPLSDGPREEDRPEYHHVHLSAGQQGMRGSEPFYRKGIGRIMDEDDDE